MTPPASAHMRPEHIEPLLSAQTRQISHLMVLIAVEHNGSFAAAARLLIGGWWKISKRLRALEKLMGTALVRRSGAGGLTEVWRAVVRSLEGA